MANGKRQLTHGELIWLTHTKTGDERLAAFHGCGIQGIGDDHVALTWLPRLQCKKGGVHKTLLARPTDATQRSLPLDKTYIESAELLRAYNARDAKKREILHRLSEQWQPGRPLTTIKQIPGITTYWIEPWAEWEIRRVTAPLQELTQTWKKHGKMRRKTVNVRVLESVDDVVDLAPNEARLDKQRLRNLLKNPTTNQVTAWTDGANKRDNTLGSGIHIPATEQGGKYLDLAWRPSGVYGVLGGEMAPFAKMAEWAHATLRLTINTDSQAMIDAWNKLKTSGYSDRELQKHPERNAISMLQHALATKPHLATNVQLNKVRSHTGIPGNEKADLLASLGAEGRAAAHVRLRESAH